MSGLKIPAAAPKSQKPTEEPVKDASQEAAEGLNSDGSLTLDINEPAPKTKAQDGSGEVPEGFESREEYDTFLKEALEARKASKAKPVEKPAEKPQEQADAQKKIAEAKLDMGALSKEWDSNGGKLTEATLKALAAKGITQEMVNHYAKGQAADLQAYTSKLTEFAGGQEKLDQMFQWAQQNWDSEAIDAANAALQSRNVKQAQFALKSLINDFNEANGESGDFISTGAPATKTTSKAPPFKSNAEVVAAMSDKRYRTDPAYRKTVEDRLRKSDF